MFHWQQNLHITLSLHSGGARNSNKWIQKKCPTPTGFNNNHFYLFTEYNFSTRGFNPPPPNPPLVLDVPFIFLITSQCNYHIWRVNDTYLKRCWFFLISGAFCSCLLPESLQATTVKQLPEYHHCTGNMIHILVMINRKCNSYSVNQYY